MILQDRWQRLQDEIAEFTGETFPDSTVASKLRHLQEEVVELLADTQDLAEWADCFILLVDAAQKAGFDTNDLYDAVVRKMTANKLRQWGEPDEDGVVRHKKTA